MPSSGLLASPPAARYGTMQPLKAVGTGLVKAHYLRGQRQRMSWLPVVTCCLTPCALFSVTVAALAFLQDSDVTYAYGIVAAGFLGVAAAGYLAIGAWRTKYRGQGRGPSWTIFFFATLALAWILGICLGQYIYNTTMSSYYAFSTLNTYSNIDPAHTPGEEVFDAGIVTFTDSASVNTSLASGFSDGTIYCVAPITTSESLTYDFWAVGTNCCSPSSSKADYHCGDYNHAGAHTGTRLLNNDARAYYRLAVQGAEAQHGIIAPWPIFFMWTEDETGGSSLSSPSNAGLKYYGYGVLGHLLLQLFLVICAAVAFSKVGHL